MNAASGPELTQASIAITSDDAAACSSSNAAAQISTLEFIELIDAAMRGDLPQPNRGYSDYLTLI